VISSVPRDVQGSKLVTQRISFCSKIQPGRSDGAKGLGKFSIFPGQILLRGLVRGDLKILERQNLATLAIAYPKS
jgi:hypothetical protein